MDKIVGADGERRDEGDDDTADPALFRRSGAFRGRDDSPSRRQRSLWHDCLLSVRSDGFGNHNPGKKRFTGMITQWDTLHPGREWVKKMSGEVPDVKMLNRRVKDFNPREA